MTVTANRPRARSVYEPEHEAFRESFRRFLDTEVVPGYENWEREGGRIPRELFRKAGSHGFLGMSVDEEFGGGGTDDFRFNAVIAEEVADAGVMSFGVNLHNDICVPYFERYADDEQKRRWLPGLASGDLIAAIAMTEPGTGSDLAGITTTAKEEGDHFVLNGSKTFISNGINADLVIVAARTESGGDRHGGLSLLVVERDTPWLPAWAQSGEDRHACAGHRRVVLRGRPGPPGGGTCWVSEVEAFVHSSPTSLRSG